MTRIRLIIRVMPVSRRDRDRDRHSDRDSAWPGLESMTHWPGMTRTPADSDTVTVWLLLVTATESLASYVCHGAHHSGGCLMVYTTPKVV
jgi:hypothetical protein